MFHGRATAHGAKLDSVTLRLGGVRDHCTAAVLADDYSVPRTRPAVTATRNDPTLTERLTLEDHDAERQRTQHIHTYTYTSDVRAYCTGRNVHVYYRILLF